MRSSQCETMHIGKRKRSLGGLYAFNCARCKTFKTKCFYSYLTVFRHRRIYGTNTAEAGANAMDREGCARKCDREEEERSSWESQDVTFSGMLQSYQCHQGGGG